MPIDIACECGWTTAVKDEYAGKRVKCPKCNTVVAVPNPTVLEDAAGAMLMEMEPTPPHPGRLTNEELEPSQEVYAMPAVAAPVLTAIPSKPRKPTRSSIDEAVTTSEGKSGLAISPGVAAGFGLMLLGGIFIAIRLSMGRLTFYGIFLVCLGLLRIITSITTGHED
jgi:hypothetical protein